MLGALEAVTRRLHERRVPHALIGATAMAGRGVVRSTDDFDLLVTERAVLQPGFWAGLDGQGFQLELAAGDDADPLAGVARISRWPADRAVDVVVGRQAWQAELLRRAEPHGLGSVQVPLALASDLILLKLYAASEQDRLDVLELLRAGDRPSLEAAVAAQIGRLPRDAQDAWRAIAAGPAQAR